MMNIRVLLFASLREHLGKSEMTLDVPVGTKMHDVFQRLFPNATLAAQYERSLLFAVNRAYAARDTILRDGDEVAFIPPVAGG